MIGNDPRYQTIIDAYRRGEFDAPYQSMDYTPSPYYNPIYDIRREQIKAGELEEGARFPLPQLDTSQPPASPEAPIDPCPPGYQLIDGVCQPDTMFQQGGGDGGERTEFESPYYGDIYLPMAGGMAQGDPNVPYGEYRIPTVNTELMRFAAQGNYQPTIGSTIGDLVRKGMQFSPVMGLLNAFGLGPSYTETITTPRFEGGGFNPFGSPTQPSQIVQPTAESSVPTGIVRPGYPMVQPTVQPAAPTGIVRPGYALPTPQIDVVSQQKLQQQQALAAELEKQRQADLVAQQAAEAERLRQLDIQRKQEAAAQQAAAEAAKQAAAKQAAQQTYKKAQQQDRGQSAGEKAREAQRRSQSVKKDISTGSRIRGGI